MPVERHVSTLVFAPETAAINQPIRVFVQTTSDGLLIGNDLVSFSAGRAVVVGGEETEEEGDEGEGEEGGEEQ